MGEPARARGDNRGVSRSGRMPEPTVGDRSVSPESPDKEKTVGRAPRYAPDSCLGAFSQVSLRGERCMLDPHRFPAAFVQEAR